MFHVYEPQEHLKWTRYLVSCFTYFISSHIQIILPNKGLMVYNTLQKSWPEGHDVRNAWAVSTVTLPLASLTSEPVSCPPAVAAFQKR